MRDLGCHAIEPTRSVALRCEPCRVTWLGCAAAADCPECGRGYDWTDPAAPPSPPSPPEGWQAALDTWLRHWERAGREVEINPYSCRATLVQRTALRRLRELMAERDRLLGL